MPAMKPYDFYEAFVIPNWREWQAQQHDPFSIRLAFNAAVAAFHLADHYFRYYEKHNADFQRRYGKGDNGLRKFQAKLVSRERNFKIIQDMANTYKHLYPRPSCSILSGGAIMWMALKDDKITARPFSKGSPDFEIVIRHKDGKTTKFSKAIESVIEMWSKIIDPASQPAI
jgi:hypothetical protein